MTDATVQTFRILSVKAQRQILDIMHKERGAMLLAGDAVGACELEQTIGIMQEIHESCK